MFHHSTRLLMLWFFVALQTMSPFIHAHAGAVKLGHGGLLHLHQGVHADTAYHAVATQEHGEEVVVAHGMPVRIATLAAASVSHPAVTAPALPRTAVVKRPGAGLPAPPARPVFPDHTLPHALAPPAA